MANKMTTKEFIFKVLNGTAIGIVVALVPNAVLSAILKPLSAHYEIASQLLYSVTIMQALVSIIIGVLVGMQFGFNPMKSAIVGAAAFISSGVVKPVALTLSDGSIINVYKMAGTGDLINVMLFSAIAVLVTIWLGDRLGSVTIVFQPIIAGALVGLVGLIALPYVSSITSLLGDIIKYFTTLQPLLMSILITISFAIIIISPISTVAIGIAVGLEGLSSGAANMGVVVTAAVLIIGSIYAKNKSGVIVALIFGAIKMMISNIARNPIMYVPIIFTAIISAIGVRYCVIMGIPTTAGFGHTGLIGPIKAYEMLVGDFNISQSMALLRVVIAYTIPFVAAFVAHILFSKVLKLYDSDIYKFDN